MRTCSNCGRQNPDDARTCSRCGRPLLSSARPGQAVSANRRRPAAVNRKRCPKCGAVMNAGATRCPRCHFSFTHRKKDLDWRLICAIAAVLVIGVLIGILVSGKRSEPVKEAQPVAVVAATDAPSPAIATEAPRAVEAAPTAVDAFAALQLSQDDDAVTVYDAQGNGKRVSRADGAAYLTGRVLEAIHSSDAPEVDVSYGDDTGWEVEVTCALDDAALSGVLAMSDEDIHRRAKNEIVSPAQSAMNTYEGEPSNIAVNWLSSDTGDLALRLAVPANPVFDELGDDPDHPQLNRFDGEDVWDDALLEDNDSWNDLDTWEDDSFDMDADVSDSSSPSNSQKIVIASDEDYIACAKDAFLSLSPTARINSVRILEIDDYGRAVFHIDATVQIRGGYQRGKYFLVLQSVSEDGNHYTHKDPTTMCQKCNDSFYYDSILHSIKYINDFGMPK